MTADGIARGAFDQGREAIDQLDRISDAIGEGYAEKWGVDGAALVRHLHALTPFEALAVADAAERFWNGGVYQQDDPIGEKLRAVGLVAREQ